MCPLGHGSGGLLGLNSGNLSQKCCHRDESAHAGPCRNLMRESIWCLAGVGLVAARAGPKGHSPSAARRRQAQRAGGPYQATAPAVLSPAALRVRLCHTAGCRDRRSIPGWEGPGLGPGLQGRQGSGPSPGSESRPPVTALVIRRPGPQAEFKNVTLSHGVT